jgi:hypothetical protein
MIKNTVAIAVALATLVLRDVPPCTLVDDAGQCSCILTTVNGTI